MTMWIDPITGRVNYDELEIIDDYVASPDNSPVAPVPPPSSESGKIIIYGRREMPAGVYHLYAIDGDGTIHDIFSGGSTVSSESIIKMHVDGDPTNPSTTAVSASDVPANAEIMEVIVRVNTVFNTGQLLTVTHDGNIIVPSSEVNLEISDVFVVKVLQLTSNADKITVNISGTSPAGSNCDVFVKFGTTFLS